MAGETPENVVIERNQKELEERRKFMASRSAILSVSEGTKNFIFLKNRFYSQKY